MSPVRVIDASVVAAWVLPDEDGKTAATLVACAPGQSLAAPFHFPAEIGNVVAMSERRRRSSPEQARIARDGVLALSFEVDAAGFDTVWGAAYPLAVRHGLTLYDALYLELALRLNLPLATFDKELMRAAAAEGVRLA